MLKPRNRRKRKLPRAPWNQTPFLWITREPMKLIINWRRVQINFRYLSSKGLIKALSLEKGSTFYLKSSALESYILSFWCRLYYEKIKRRLFDKIEIAPILNIKFLLHVTALTAQKQKVMTWKWHRCEPDAWLYQN